MVLSVASAGADANSARRGGACGIRDGLMRSKVRFSSLGGSLYVHSAFPTSAAEAVFFGPDTYRFAALIARTLARQDQARVRTCSPWCTRSRRSDFPTARAARWRRSDIAKAWRTSSEFRFRVCRRACCGARTTSRRCSPSGASSNVEDTSYGPVHVTRSHVRRPYPCPPHKFDRDLPAPGWVRDRKHPGGRKPDPRASPAHRLRGPMAPFSAGIRMKMGMPLSRRRG